MEKQTPPENSKALLLLTYGLIDNLYAARLGTSSRIGSFIDFLRRGTLSEKHRRTSPLDGKLFLELYYETAANQPAVMPFWEDNRRQ